MNYRSTIMLKKLTGNKYRDVATELEGGCDFLTDSECGAA